MAPTVTPTETAVTEPTEQPTEAPTEAPAESSTEPPTEAPTEPEWVPEYNGALGSAGSLRGTTLLISIFMIIIVKLLKYDLFIKINYDFFSLQQFFHLFFDVCGSFSNQFINHTI